MGTGTWVLTNAACAFSTVQQRVYVSIHDVTKRLSNHLKYNDKLFVKRFVTQHCLSSKRLLMSILMSIVMIRVLNDSNAHLYIGWYNSLSLLPEYF